MENKYDSIELVPLIKRIQEAHIRLQKPETKKKLTTTGYSKSVKELNEMRVSATNRLKQMDRSKPEFFAVGLHVDYRPYVPPSADEWETSTQTIKGAMVVGLDDRYSYITLDGEGITVKVDPNTLTIRHLRHHY